MKKGVDYPGVTVSFFCHDGEGNYVFQKRGTNCRDEHGRWDNGGGGLDTHDTVIDTLKKEIKEEYCVDTLDYEFLGYRDVHREHEGVKTHWISLDFKVRVDRGRVQNGEPHKFDEIAWFRLDTIPEPRHSQMDAALEQHKGKL